MFIRKNFNYLHQNVTFFCLSRNWVRFPVQLNSLFLKKCRSIRSSGLRTFCCFMEKNWFFKIAFLRLPLSLCANRDCSYSIFCFPCLYSIWCYISYPLLLGSGLSGTFLCLFSYQSICFFPWAANKNSPKVRTVFPVDRIARGITIKLRLFRHIY